MEIDESLLCQVTQRYCEERGPFLVLVLSPTGEVLRANRFAQQLTGRALAGEPFERIIVDLRKRFRLEAAMDRGGKEMLLNIDHEDGSPESFFFSFHAVGDAILALGRNDPFETEHVRKQLLAVNRELSNLSRQLQKKKVQMEQALEHIKALQGVIPICMHCRKIRNDQQIWERVEAYIEEHSDAKMSHSLCPDCAAELYRETPELDESSA